ncbi:MAG: hypothetical protein CME59_00640 [Halioglobus sp.]|nr:hypothetical protein [Halioglobus sp.]
MIDKLTRQVLLSLVCALGGMVCLPALADDTEIYKTRSLDVSSGRPKVLIIMDDSGSMDTTVEGQRPAYDPTKTDYQGGISGSEFDRIYWSTGDNGPPRSNSDNWFAIDRNRCASSFDALDNQGFFQTASARRWVDSSTETTCTITRYYCSNTGATIYRNRDARRCRRNGGSVRTEESCETNTLPGRWRSLSDNVNYPAHVECESDVTGAEPGNGPSVADGYPQDNVADGDALGAATPEDADDIWGSTTYKFYSANYIDYWNDDSLTEDRTRMAIAQDVIADLVSANTGVDFGLATFNRNDNGENEDGGRIIHRIIPNMTAGERSGLVDMIENDLDADGWTPLCETYYEAYRYLSGKSVRYGDNRDTGGSPDRDLPPRDLNAENGSKVYNSPHTDCQYAYIILMTDGLPTYDTAANSSIESLTGKTCRYWEDDIGGNGNPKNCLPELAEYMATTDLDGDDENGVQKAVTYTIGFEIDQPLLSETARLGGGDYNTAFSADELAGAFSSVIDSILSDAGNFTSPATAVDSFSRTQSRDVVYYAMFKPAQRVDWRGNIKKFKIADTGDGPFVVDRNNFPAIDPVSRDFKANASSYWSTQDGPTVDKGGVGGLLAARDPATRRVFTNTGTGGALEVFETDNITPDAYDPPFEDDAALWAQWGVGSAADLAKVVNWGLGYDAGVVANGPREWILGDILHSQPQVVNYGSRGGFSDDNPDLRVLVGTNTGFVHMFGDDNGQEDWAFFPKEFGSILNDRRLNAVSSGNVYGMDLTPVVYKLDVDRDGSLDHTQGDKVWAYFGMRRGGDALYALDISDPDNPAFLWAVGRTLTENADEMGQTWSQPVITYIPGYTDDQDLPKPVVIVGAGYDPNKDSHSVGTADSMGRGIFFIDAETGTVIRTVTPDAGSLLNVQADGLQDSVPSEVAVLDSNNDLLTDRVYFGDTGGNVWRVDIGPRLPDAGDSTETWFATRLAVLGGNATDNDRRFFYKPEIALLTLANGESVDAVMLGSGDRTNPLATDVDNFFYLLRDPQTTLYTDDAPTAAECDDSDPDNYPLDNRCFLPISHAALFDVPDNRLLNGADEDDKADAVAELLAAPGWKYALTLSGEKVTTSGSVLAGELDFATFSPVSLAADINTCTPASGTGLRYYLDIFFDPGTPDDPPPDPLPPGDIPDDTSLYVTEEGQVYNPESPKTPPDPNDPDDDDSGFKERDAALPPPYGNYWYSEEY